MIKSIIFDLGGVLFRDGTLYAIQEMKERFKFSDELCSKLLRGRESVDLRKGLITPDEFWDFVRTKIPKAMQPYEIRSIWYGNYLPNPEMFRLLARLKPRYKLGAISGNVREKVDYLDGKYGFRKYFDVEVYSFDMHTNKPDKLMWKRALRLLDSRACECVYVDNRQESVDAADSLGFDAFLFKDSHQTAQELSLLHII